jgi:hypothetical protein
MGEDRNEIGGRKVGGCGLQLTIGGGGLGVVLVLLCVATATCISWQSYITPTI